MLPWALQINSIKTAVYNPQAATMDEDSQCLRLNCAMLGMGKKP